MQPQQISFDDEVGNSKDNSDIQTWPGFWYAMIFQTFEIWLLRRGKYFTIWFDIWKPKVIWTHYAGMTLIYPLNVNSFSIHERQIQFQKLTFLQNGQWYQISFDHKHGNDALWCVDVLRFFLWRQISGQMVALVYIVCKFQ